MRIRFDEQLSLLNKKMIEMGAECESIIALSAKALLEGNAAGARKAKEQGHKIDQMEREIESICLKLLLQQQRLCIARALAVEPKVLLMDEPTSALDPISTSRIEELALQLKEKYTIIIVTHNMQQAVRISDNTAFFLLGELVEFGETEKLFSQPMDKRTEDYITGRFG